MSDDKHVNNGIPPCWKPDYKSIPYLFMEGMANHDVATIKAQAKTIVALAEALGTYSHYKNDPITYAGDVLTQHAEAIEQAREELENG